MQSAMSPHEIGVLEVLEICRLRDRLPSSIEFFLAIPENVEPGLELSPTFAPRVHEVARMVADCLREAGYEVKDA